MQTVFLGAVILIVIRVLFDGVPRLEYIVAGINIVALSIVIYTIVGKICTNIEARIRHSNVPPQIQIREKMRAKRLLYGIVTFILVGGVGFYFKIGCTALVNDIMAIIALAISIADEDIIQYISSSYKL